MHTSETSNGGRPRMDGRIEASFRSVRLTVGADGLRLHTYDIGELVEKVFGHDDYEFLGGHKGCRSAPIGCGIVGRKILRILKATDELRAFCERHQIPNKWASW